MSYTVTNFKTKKAVKEAVIHYVENNAGSNNGAEPVRCYNPGLGPDLSNFSGSVYLEGPHHPQPHKWYCEGVMKDGILVKIK